MERDPLRERALAGGRQRPSESGGTFGRTGMEGPTESPPPAPVPPGKPGGRRTTGSGRRIDHRRSRSRGGAIGQAAPPATSGLERSPSGRTDRHRSDHDQRLAVVGGKKGTTDVPAAEGGHGNPIGRVMTGDVGRGIAGQRREERCSAAGRAVALGQTRGVGRPRGYRPPRLAVGHDRFVSNRRPVVSGQPIAATGLDSGASQEPSGQRHQRHQGPDDGAHEAARSRSQGAGTDGATHGTKNPRTSWDHESVATPPNTISPF